MLIRYIRNDLEGVYTAEMLRGSISMLAGVAFYELTGTGAAITFTNVVQYELPNTGGAGTVPYTVGGFLLLTGAAFLLLYNHTKRRKEDSSSS